MRTAIVEHDKLPVGGLEEADRLTQYPALLEGPVELVSRSQDVPRLAHQRGERAGCPRLGRRGTFRRMGSGSHREVLSSPRKRNRVDHVRSPA